MTGLEFIAAGGRFARRGERYVVYGPKDRDDVLAAFRSEISTRIKLVGDGSGFLRTQRKPWSCDVCEDLIGCARDGSCPLCGLTDEHATQLCRYQYGGTCELCVLARQKALDLRRERETTEQGAAPEEQAA